VVAAVAAVAMEEESPCQTEDQNGSELELDRIHEAYEIKSTNRSFLWWTGYWDRVATDSRGWYIIRFSNRLRLPQI